MTMTGCHCLCYCSTLLHDQPPLPAPTPPARLCFPQRPSDQSHLSRGGSGCQGAMLGSPASLQCARRLAARTRAFPSCLSIARPAGAAVCCSAHSPCLLPSLSLAVPQQIDLGRNLDAQRSFVQEALSLQRLRHPHVVAFFGVRQAAQLGLGLWQLVAAAASATLGSPCVVLFKRACPIPVCQSLHLVLCTALLQHTLLPASMPPGLQPGWPAWHHSAGVLRGA